MLSYGAENSFMKTKKNRLLLLPVFAFGFVFVLAGCGANGNENDDAVISLNYVNFPPAPTFPCVQMERWKEQVEARTEGRVKINTFPGGTLLAAKDIFDGVVLGHADIGNFAMSYQPGRFPVSESIDLPHFFPDSKTATKKLAALIKETNPEEFKGVEVLAMFTCPPAVVMSSVKNDTLEALKNLPLRSSGTGADLIAALGAKPVAMPQSDVLDALQKGVVKGNVSSAEVLKDMNYAAYCPFVYKADLPVVSFAVVMNKARFDKLPENIREIFRSLYDEHSAWTADYVDQHADDAIAWAQDENNGNLKRKLEIFTPTDAEKTRLRASAVPLFEAYEKKYGTKAKNALDFIRDAK